MIIDSMTPRSIKKLRWILTLLVIALVIGMAISSFVRWNSVYPYGENAPSVWYVIWNYWFSPFVAYIYLFIIAISILKWPLWGGVFVTAVSSYRLIQDIVFTVRYVSPVSHTAPFIAETIMAFLATMCGLILILIGFNKYKAVTPPV